MQFCNIEEIPSRVKEGKLTEAEGAKLLESVVRTNPAHFGITHLNNEITTILMMNFAGNCSNIIKVFDPAGGTLLVQLTNYIHYLVRDHKHLWLNAQKVHTVFDEEEDPPRMHGVRRTTHEISSRRRRVLSHHRGEKVALLSLV